AEPQPAAALPAFAQAEAQPASTLLAGVANLDATWHVGASSGQYAGEGPGAINQHGPGVDPHVHSTTSRSSYGIQGRESVRALVVGGDGERFALVSNDLYIPMDVLHRRVGQLLEAHDRAVSLGLVDGVPTGIDATRLVTSVSHSHSSPFYSSTTWGPWAFQDVFDLRYFEHISRVMAAAVVAAASDLRPVRVGASQSDFRLLKRHSYGPQVGDDGLPAGFPEGDVDGDLTVVAFDDLGGPEPKPLATWVVWGLHPEMLDGNDLLTTEWVQTMERNVERELGGVVVYSQRDTGTAEPDRNAEANPPELRQEFSHREYAQMERAAQLIGDAVVMNRRAIDAGADGVEPVRLRDGATLPAPHLVLDWATDAPVAMTDLRFAPPGARPSPTVSNCRSEKVFDGNVGIPIIGLPDCGFQLGALGQPLVDALRGVGLDQSAVYEGLRDAGVPVPDSYGAPSFGSLQESATVHLQAIRLGDIAITVCPCEQWADQARNIEARLDEAAGNLWFGFDWTANSLAHAEFEPGVVYDGRGGVDENGIRHGPLQLVDDEGRTWCEPDDADGNVLPTDELGNPVSDGEVLWRCRDPEFHPSPWLPPRDRDGDGDVDADDEWLDPVDDEVFRRMKAQLYNDARGWDDLGNSARAESEHPDVEQVWGNFTHEELHATMEGGGYRLVLPIAMSNDYWGYIASFREFQSHDHYRKALTGLGPHSMDWLATRLARMAASLKGGPPVELNPKDRAYVAEDHRTEETTRLVGTIASAALPAYEATLPADGGTPRIEDEPADEIRRFEAATATWVGGSNFTDAPHARVERCVDPDGVCDPEDDGAWEIFADGQGEVQVVVGWPEPPDLPLWRAGRFEWRWTATFEAFDSDVEIPDAQGVRRRQTPEGVYRFAISGCHRGAVPAGGEPSGCGSSDPRVSGYQLASEPFRVLPFEGLTVSDLRLTDDGVSLLVGPRPTFGVHTSNAEHLFDLTGTQAVDYPDSYESPFAFIDATPNVFEYGPGEEDDERYCLHCSFRPWADTGAIASVTVTVVRGGELPAAEQARGRNLRGVGAIETVAAVFDPDSGRWEGTVDLRHGDIVYVERGGVVDAFGEFNGLRSDILTVGPGG
ncbi:MAG: hypothetical protein ACRDUY_07370, partial [Nitriliruptorales bacterium]